ncbi:MULTISPECIES: hypothetical protein [Methylomonas]|uniref:Response regulatory domain-containing protein n=2 Tax=Methylomonas TaxID=416 RepID=A0A126T8M7_9GAMM|nr:MULTISPECIES: hypothetical protein [Methylomonas]AMK78449.1 hypothetical protein JT25_018455 [Methylomonas denitrificans]OAI04151.1 hypothetical protein A1342_06380 [Methylomonas methanica]TCV87521.1 hypothetical protein EDE11_10222 [Methylomonas methanica]
MKQSKAMPGGCEKLPTILVCDRYTGFREGLRNFLLSAGYAQVEVVASVRLALIKLRQQRFEFVLIGVSPPALAAQRLALVTRCRQPDAKIFYLVDAKDQPFIKDTSVETILKEYVYSNLLELI